LTEPHDSDTDDGHTLDERSDGICHRRSGGEDNESYDILRKVYRAVHEEVVTDRMRRGMPVIWVCNVVWTVLDCKKCGEVVI